MVQHGGRQFFASFSSNLCLEASNNMFFLQSKISQGSIFLIHIHSSELLEATQRKSIKRVKSEKQKTFELCYILFRFLDRIFLDLI